MAEIEAKKKQSTEDMDFEIKKIELENAKLSLEEKKANLQDLKERLAEREMKRETRQQRFITNGQALKTTHNLQKAIESICNHKKRVNGVEGLISGKGTVAEMAIIQHKFLNGDLWTRCLHCGKTWKPPVKSMFTSKAGEFDQKGYDALNEEYKKSLDFFTDNSPSGANTWQFSDGGESYREATKGSTLR